jgi:probable HAF family extracellular repeat protein
MKRCLYSLVALGLLVSVTGRAMAQPSYGFTTLDVPGATGTGTSARGINASGQIVGCYGEHVFLLDHGSYTTLDVPGSSWTQANGINASGQIVGWYLDGNGEHGFLLDQGSFTTLDAPGQRADATFSLSVNSGGRYDAP